MKRRPRPGIAEKDPEASKPTRPEIEADIARCLVGFNTSGTSQTKKAYFKRLVWLEEYREKLFEVPAPKRVFNR